MKDKLGHAAQRISAVWSALRVILHDIFYTILFVWIVSILALQTGVMLDEHETRSQRKVYDALDFDEIIPYHRLFPPFDYVYYSTEARFVSDSEVLPVVEKIEGGVRIDWFEVITCDHNPYDSRENYEFYAEADSSGSMKTHRVKRRTQEEIASLKGFIVRVKRPDNYDGLLPAIMYPKHDADCRLESAMRMKLFNTMYKTFMMVSEPVHVRGILP